MWEEFRVGGILWEESHGEESRLGGIPWEESRVGGILVGGIPWEESRGRNSAWEESRWNHIYLYNKALRSYIFVCINVSYGWLDQMG